MRDEILMWTWRAVAIFATLETLLLLLKAAKKL